MVTSSGGLHSGIGTTISGAQIVGIEEYRNQLSVLSAKQQRRIWRGIFRATGQTIVQKAARQNLRSLGLRKHAGKITTRARATNQNVEARIGARRRTQIAYIGHLIENGTRPHVIKIRRKKALAKGKVIFGKSIQHPGTVARPWLKPAVSDTAQMVSDDITRRAAAEMEKLKRA